MPSGDLLTEWREIRSKVLASKVATEALKSVSLKNGLSIYEISKRSGMEYHAVLKALRRLRKYRVVIGKGRGRRVEYNWTIQGVMMFPELAPENELAGTLQSFLGEYDGVVKYLASGLDVSENVAEVVLKVFLQYAREFFAWLREYAFSMTGVRNPDDTEYYREQMINFLGSFFSMPMFQEWIQQLINESPETAKMIVEVAEKLLSSKIKELKRASEQRKTAPRYIN